MVLQMILFFALLPMLEIIVLVKAGQYLGAWNTIGMLILSGIFGLYLLKQEGRRVLQTVLSEIRRGVLPSLEITHGVVLAVASILFIIPGFVSDVVALLLLVPAVRLGAAKWMEQQMLKRSFFGSVQVNVATPENMSEIWPPQKPVKDVTPEKSEPARVLDFASAKSRAANRDLDL